MTQGRVWEVVRSAFRLHRASRQFQERACKCNENIETFHTKY
jgi:hypothetical protein